MKLTKQSTNLPELKVFHQSGDTPIVKRSTEFSEQLPFVDSLIEQFEKVTGWTISFDEARSSYINRNLSGREMTIDGSLSIADMSDNLEPGSSAQHRGYCDQLVATLDSMIGIIQSDRQRFDQIQHNLNPVVELPFEWWGLSGNSGFSRRGFSSWSVSANEKIRLFAGQLNANNELDVPLGSSMVVAAFDAACQTEMQLEDIAPLIPGVLQRSAAVSCKLNWFTTIELDPITGEYEIDGYNATDGLAMIDVHASTAFELGADEHRGTLFSGQILAIGIGQDEIVRINELIANEDMSVDQCRQLLQREFAKTAAIFLFRK